MTTLPTRSLPARLVAAGAFLGWLLATPATHAGDVTAGKNVFKSECAECHSVKEGTNKKGPSLFGIVGRKAGSVAGFAYSDAMLQSGRTWNAEALHGYLSQPAKQALPGTKMKYDGLDHAKDLDDLLSYLATLK
ncbi:c-type cytochrome [Luteibacter sahnii]|uniref:c-type cytochrome n=1 Tax=Luteibacter sahnii TaxID=3021977 RepID=UPI00387EBD4B